MEKIGEILLIGFGNPGRLDDGLGPALAEAIESMEIPGVTVDSDYQLTVEDSVSIAQHDYVVFADASVNCEEPFCFKPVEPKTSVSFSSHSIDPEAVVGLAHDLHGAKTKAYILGVRGYEFNEFGQQLSQSAKDNLAKAIEFIEKVLREKKFSE